MSTDNEIVIVAYVNHVDCPHCGASQTGFLNDPRGVIMSATSAKKAYHVAKDARVDLG